MSDAKVLLTGVQATVEVGEVAISIDGPDRSEVKDFVRGKAICRRLDDGHIEITLLDRPRRGRPNEPHVLGVLAQALGGADTRATTREEDARGFDGFVKPRGAVTWTGVQVVSVPTDSAYAAAVARGDWTVVLSLADAARWIADAIEHKADDRGVAVADRAGLLLALDIRHAGLLADADVLATFNANHPGHANRGFASVWLVASASVRCARLA